MVSVHLSVSEVEEVDLKLAVDDGVTLTLDGIYVDGHVPAYEGAYEVTPAMIAIEDSAFVDQGGAYFTGTIVLPITGAA